MILSSSQLRDLFVFQFSSLFFILFFSFPCVFFGQTQNAKTIHKNNDSYNNNNNKRERENVKEENKILWKTRCRVICLMNYIVIYLFCDCLTWRFVLHFSVFFFRLIHLKFETIFLLCVLSFKYVFAGEHGDHHHLRQLNKQSISYCVLFSPSRFF